MKRKLIAILALCVLALSGCSSGKPDVSLPDTTPDDANNNMTYTLEEIYANNSVENVLRDHTVFTCHMDTYEGADSDTPIGTSDKQFSMEDGSMQMTAHYSYDGTDSYQWVGADKDFNGASYTVFDGEKHFIACPGDEYQDLITANWMGEDLSLMDETILSTSMQDGAAVIETLTTYKQEAEMYARTLYYVDPETGLLYGMETTTYSLPEGTEIPDAVYGMDENEVLTVQKTAVTYDTPITFDVDPKAEIIGQGQDYCEVTFDINPATDQMEVNWYPIAHGTHISFYSAENYTVYDDETLENDVTYEDIISEGEAMTLYMVMAE